MIPCGWQVEVRRKDYGILGSATNLLFSPRGDAWSSCVAGGLRL